MAPKIPLSRREFVKDAGGLLIGFSLVDATMLPRLLAAPADDDAVLVPTPGRLDGWLRIQSDDRPESEALLQPKETATWTAQRQFKILLGNAGGVEISLNGNPQGPLGKSGEVVHLLLPDEIKPPNS